MVSIAENNRLLKVAKKGGKGSQWNRKYTITVALKFVECYIPHNAMI